MLLTLTACNRDCTCVCAYAGAEAPAVSAEEGPGPEAAPGPSSWHADHAQLQPADKDEPDLSQADLEWESSEVANETVDASAYSTRGWYSCPVTVVNKCSSGSGLTVRHARAPAPPGLKGRLVLGADVLRELLVAVLASLP